MKDIFETFKALDIHYKLYKHKAVFNMSESKALDIGFKGSRPKNILLRHKNGYFYLVSTHSDSLINTKHLAKQLGVSKRFSMATPEELFEILHIRPGSVSPYCLINSDPEKVRYIINEELLKDDHISFHPNRNDMTVELLTSDFRRFLASLQHQIIELELQ